MSRPLSHSEKVRKPSAVRSVSQLEDLLKELDMDAQQLRDALKVMGQTKKEDKTEDSFRIMRGYLRELQKARRLHRRRPHIPAHIMRQIVRLRLANPVRLW